MQSFTGSVSKYKSSSYPGPAKLLLKHAVISSGIFISVTLSGKPNWLLAFPFSEQSGISLDVKNTLAPDPPPNVSLIGSYPPGEPKRLPSANGSNCPNPVPWKKLPSASVPVSSPRLT